MFPNWLSNVITAHLNKLMKRSVYVRHTQMRNLLMLTPAHIYCYSFKYIATSRNIQAWAWVIITVSDYACSLADGCLDIMGLWIMSGLCQVLVIEWIYGMCGRAMLWQWTKPFHVMPATARARAAAWVDDWMTRSAAANSRASWWCWEYKPATHSLTHWLAQTHTLTAVPLALKSL